VDLLTVLQAWSTPVVAAATIVYVALTSRLAAEARRQAEAAQEQLSLARRPHLLLSPHPFRDEAGNTRARIINFGTLPAHITGGWLEATQKAGEHARPFAIGLTLGETAGSSPNGLTAPGEQVEFLVPDWQPEVSEGRYHLKVMFAYPSYPGRTLIFLVPMQKGPDQLTRYYLDEASYDFGFTLGEREPAGSVRRGKQLLSLRGRARRT
jgi:hypothetical protein